MEDFLDFTNSNSNTNMEKPKKIYKMGVYLFTCNGWQKSSDIEGYTKTPFTKVKGTDADGSEIEIMIWHPKEGDTDQYRTMKIEIGQKFFENLGAGVGNLKGDDLLNDCIGKSCKVAMKEKERFGTTKDGKPMIFTDALYWYSGKAHEELSFDAGKAKLPLKETERTQFLQASSQYDSQQVSSQAPAETSSEQPEGSDGLPW